MDPEGSDIGSQSVPQSVPQSVVQSAPAPTPKAALRKRLLAARAARSVSDLAAARVLIAGTGSARAATLTCVAAYEPMKTEPGSLVLLAGLAARGVRVLVPVLMRDRDLTWTVWPTTEAAQIGSAQLLFVPALAVDPAGQRLGRGGGSYDRVLARVRPGTPVVALLFDDEVLPSVPVDSWDEPVTAVLTPSGWRELGRPE